MLSRPSVGALYLSHLITRLILVIEVPWSRVKGSIKRELHASLIKSNVDAAGDNHLTNKLSLPNPLVPLSSNDLLSASLLGLGRLAVFFHDVGELRPG